MKSVYRQYTEGFGAIKPRSAEEEHLGILGPVIRAAVGDRIIVHFKNNTRFPASIHPHGVQYTQAHEGAAHAHAAGDAHQQHGVVAPGGNTLMSGMFQNVLPAATKTLDMQPM